MEFQCPISKLLAYSYSCFVISCDSYVIRYITQRGTYQADGELKTLEFNLSEHEAVESTKGCTQLFKKTMLYECHCSPIIVCKV